MVNARRAARELALKVLFQVDVGKQPLEEVMQGALEQIRHTVDHPVSQLLHDLQAELKALIDERRPDLTTQSLRQVRNVAKSLQQELARLTEETSRQSADMLAHPGTMSVESAGGLVSREADSAEVHMRRAGERETLQPEIVRIMVENAMRRATLVPAAFNRAAVPAHSTAAFLHTLVDGVLEKRNEIDKQVAGLSEGWALDRQPAVDRNILRVAAYEVIFLPDVPVGASINEAVELAKKFSTAESGRFINGVLGAIAAAVGRVETNASGRQTVAIGGEGDAE